MEIREVTYLAVAVRILSAVLIGGLIGLERGLKNRPAGMRTYMLVCTGSCLIMLTNQFIYQCYGVGDPVRMGAQVVSGIGFLGAGTIIITRRSQIRGLTTAAGLWASAGVGLALGVGFYEAALVGAFAVFFVMTMLQRIDSRMHRNSRTIGIYVELSQDVSLGDFLHTLRSREIVVTDLVREHDSQADQSMRSYLITLRTRHRQNHLVLLEELSKIPGVTFAEEL